jgi:hypothetical protein
MASTVWTTRTAWVCDMGLRVNAQLAVYGWYQFSQQAIDVSGFLNTSTFCGSQLISPRARRTGGGIPDVTGGRPPAQAGTVRQQ